ncbi:hypothetical protein GPECTOR_2g1380 [Gonium pectorale]|uniref:Cdc23 domain-containing protein n=1 Tax=Gonium pectorale TaxID=33097 RepID=A0A150H125_GONPE|nr:hypothetical protein GPECTOR_2g1380 [Gonium pectorale]|eukprot:KXZ55829.1 hypothetical protein GPECTOR_2g1380 [Gonium pectorale]
MYGRIVGKGLLACVAPRVDPNEHHPQYLLARAYLQAKEYRRCAHALSGPGLCGPLPAFLRLYASYLAGEKRREEERIEKGGPLGRAPELLNPELEGLEAELGKALAPLPGEDAGGGTGGGSGGGGGGEGNLRGDPFLLYLHGLVLAGRGRVAEALEALAASLRAYPVNWSAWMAVQSICTGSSVAGGLAGLLPPGAVLDGGPPPAVAAAPSPSADPSTSSPLPPLPAGLPVHWTRDFFHASLALCRQHNQEALSRLQGLAQLFRGSLAVESLVASAHYGLQNLDDAQALLEDLVARDPYRLEWGCRSGRGGAGGGREPLSGPPPPTL